MLAQASAVLAAPTIRPADRSTRRRGLLQALANVIERTGRDEDGRAECESDHAYWTTVARGL